MPDIVNLQSQERVDLGDLSFGLGVGQLGFQSTLVNAILATPNSNQEMWVIDGFIPSNPTGSQLEVTLGSALLAYRTGADVEYGVVTTEGEASQILDLSQYAPGTYNIYIRFNYQPTNTSSRVFWNPANAGSEFAQSVPTRMSAAWELRVENANPGPEWLQIGTVVTPTMTIVDMRPLYFEGRVDQNYDIQWGSPDDRDSDRSTHGLKDFQTFVQAMQQCLTEIKGSGIRNWYSSNIGGMAIGFDATPYENRVAVGDESFFLGHDSSDFPTLSFDSNSYFNYQRTAQQYSWVVSGTTALTLSASNFNVYAALVGHAGASITGQTTINISNASAALVLNQTASATLNMDLRAPANEQIDINFYAGSTPAFALTRQGGSNQMLWFDNINGFYYEGYNADTLVYSIGAPRASAQTIITSMLNVQAQGTGQAVVQMTAPSGQTVGINWNTGSYAYSFGTSGSFISLYENQNNTNIIAYNTAVPVLTLGYSGVAGGVQIYNGLYIPQRNSGHSVTLALDSVSASQQAAINFMQNGTTVYQTVVTNSQWALYDSTNHTNVMIYDYSTRGWDFTGASAVNISSLTATSMSTGAFTLTGVLPNAYVNLNIYNSSSTTPGSSISLNTSAVDLVLRNRTDGKFDIFNATSSTSMLTVAQGSTAAITAATATSSGYGFAQQTALIYNSAGSAFVVGSQGTLQFATGTGYMPQGVALAAAGTYASVFRLPTPSSGFIDGFTVYYTSSTGSTTTNGVTLQVLSVNTSGTVIIVTSGTSFTISAGHSSAQTLAITGLNLPVPPAGQTYYLSVTTTLPTSPATVLYTGVQTNVLLTSVPSYYH